MTQAVTQLLARDAYNMMGASQSIFIRDLTHKTATCLALTNITTVRVAVLNESHVKFCIAMLTINPSTKFNIVIVADIRIRVSWAKQRDLAMQLITLGCVDSVEGVNEYNLFATHAPDQTAAYANAAEQKAGCLAWAQVIHDAFASYGVKIYSSTLAGNLVGSATETARLIPTLTGLVTHMAVHHYPGMGGYLANDDGHGSLQEGNRSLPWLLKWTQAASGVMPTVITETGSAGTAVLQPGVVDQTTQAKQMSTFPLDCMALGLQKVFIYNLLNDTVDTKNNLGSEGHYGLVDPDLTLNPAGQVIRRMQDMLYDPPRQGGMLRDPTGRASKLGDLVRTPGPTNASYTPAPLTVTVTGLDNTASAAGQYLAFRKSDGSDLVALWNEPVIYANQAAVTPATLTVTAGWGALRRFQVTDMLSGATVSAGTGSWAMVPLQGYAMMVRLLPQ